MSTCKKLEKYYQGDKIDFYFWATAPDNVIDNDFVLTIISPFNVGIEFPKASLVLADDKYYAVILPTVTKNMRTGTYRAEIHVNGECTAKFEDIFILEDSYSKKFE